MVCFLAKESNKKDVKGEYYGWSPSADASKEYPAEVIRGYFYKGKELAFVPNGSVLNGGWRMDGMQMRGAFFIPEGLKITFLSFFLSFVENKFYEADVKLPSDLILHYFREGYIDYDSKKKETYSNIYIGIAPGGVLVIWMAGSGNQQVEIGRYQAMETEVEMKEVNPSGIQDRKEYVNGTIHDYPEVVENLNIAQEDMKGILFKPSLL